MSQGKSGAALSLPAFFLFQATAKLSELEAAAASSEALLLRCRRGELLAGDIAKIVGSDKVLICLV